MFVYLLCCHVLNHTVSALLINVVFTSTLLKYIFFYFINSWYIYLQPIHTYVCTPCTYYVICLEKTGAHKPVWFPAPFVIIISIYVLYSRVIICVDTALDLFPFTQYYCIFGCWHYFWLDCIYCNLYILCLMTIKFDLIWFDLIWFESYIIRKYISAP